MTPHMDLTTQYIPWRDCHIHVLHPSKPVPSCYRLSAEDHVLLSSINHPARKQSFLRSRFLMDTTANIPATRRQRCGYLWSDPPVSLTHKNGWVFCGVKTHNPDLPGASIFGIDCEKTELGSKLTNKILARWAPHLKAPDLEPCVLGAMVFSARESLYKGWSRLAYLSEADPPTDFRAVSLTSLLSLFECATIIPHHQEFLCQFQMIKPKASTNPQLAGLLEALSLVPPTVWIQMIWLQASAYVLSMHSYHLPELEA